MRFKDLAASPASPKLHSETKEIDETVWDREWVSEAILQETVPGRTESDSLRADVWAAVPLMVTLPWSGV